MSDHGIGSEFAVALFAAALSGAIVGVAIGAAILWLARSGS